MAEAGRECGACTVCCIVPGIDTREIQKRTGAVCRHCSGGGCAIYEARPKACREFFCAWMQDDRLGPAPLGPEWRPDLSGVLAQSITISRSINRGSARICRANGKLSLTSAA